jgi:hypothetical protein
MATVFFKKAYRKKWRNISLRCCGIKKSGVKNRDFMNEIDCNNNELNKIIFLASIIFGG